MPAYPPRRTGFCCLRKKKENYLAKAPRRKGFMTSLNVIPTLQEKYSRKGVKMQRLYNFSLRLLFFARKKENTRAKLACGRLPFFGRKKDSTRAKAQRRKGYVISLCVFPTLRDNKKKIVTPQGPIILKHHSQKIK